MQAARSLNAGIKTRSGPMLTARTSNLDLQRRSKRWFDAAQAFAQ